MGLSYPVRVSAGIGTGHGCIRRLGRHDHRLGGKIGMFSYQISWWKMEASGCTVSGVDFQFLFSNSVLYSIMRARILGSDFVVRLIVKKKIALITIPIIPQYDASI